MKNFWEKLPRPFCALAPMDDVTDTVFRQIVFKAAPPDVSFTEFTNVDGLVSQGRNVLLKKLQFTKKEQPLIAQIWGLKPENFLVVSKNLVEMGFCGIDINMGCPERTVVKAGACSALINNRNLAREIIEATKEGAGHLPVSVKTRIGMRQIQTEDWIGFLLEQNLEALTIHARTVFEMSKVPAHWDEIKKVVTMRDSMGLRTAIIGNGDVANYQEAIQKAPKYGVDGVMIGRGIFNNLWCLDKNGKLGTTEEKLKMALYHIELFEKTWGASKNPQILKKFFKIYVNGFDGASDLRVRLMETKDFAQMSEIVAHFLG